MLWIHSQILQLFRFQFDILAYKSFDISRQSAHLTLINYLTVSTLITYYF